MQSAVHAHLTAQSSHRKRSRRVCLALGALLAVTAATAQTAQPGLQQLYDKAVSLQSTGDTEQATFAYRIFIASAVAELASDHARLGDNTLAAAQYEEALALRPNDPDLVLHTAQAERDANHLARARELAGKLLAGNSKSAPAHALLGSLLARTGDTDAAIKEDETALAIDPSIANGFALAKAYLLKKDEKSAGKLFAEMLASAPKDSADSAALHMDIGRTYGEGGYPDQAIVEFKRALAKDPKLPGLHYSLGASYLLSMGEIDFPLAAAEFYKELALHPDDFLSHSQLGYIALSQHHYPEAEKELRRAVEINPRDPDTLLSLGQLYVDTSRPADAEPILRRSIALTTDPSRNHYQVQRAHYLLGRVLMANGHPDQAKAEMQTSTGLLKLATLENQGKSPAEIAAANQTTANPTTMNSAADRSPDRPTPLPFSSPDTAPSGSSQAEQEMKDLEHRLSPAIADSYNNLGATSARDGNYPAAVDAFTRAAQWNPALEGLDYNLGRAAYTAKNYTAAVAPLGRYLAQHPNDSWFRSAEGVSLFMTGSYRQSVDTLRPIEPALQKVPQLASIYAAALIEAGDTAQGIARLQQLEAADPNRPEFHRMLGKAWQRTGDNARAEQELRAALRLDPNDSDTQKRLAQLEQARPSSEPK